MDLRNEKSEISQGAICTYGKLRFQYGLHSLCAFVWLALSRAAFASEYRGQAVFSGFPVPGAFITATQGTKRLHSLSQCSTAWAGSKSDTSRVALYPGGLHESRTGFEDRVSAGGTALLGFSFSLGDVYATRACVIYDAQPLRHARRLLASSNTQPVGESQPDRLHGLVQLGSRRRYGHSGIAQHDFTWRTDRCGNSGGHRRSLDRARAGEAAYAVRLTPQYLSTTLTVSRRTVEAARLLVR